MPGTFLALLTALSIYMQDSTLLTPYERGNGNQTATYAETIAYYQLLAHKFTTHARLIEAGKTDVGKPLHIFAISNDGDFRPNRPDRRVVLINNGIHPGEPEGIDASMLLARNLLTTQKHLLANTLVIIIPVYNIDGMLNRTAYSRANQNGPEHYGFRGNARNLDLNRDFIKCDSRNAKSFVELFQYWQPDVFIDTHTSNGADYPYTMTLISTQHNKLGGKLGKYLHTTFEPLLYENMRTKGEEMCPYVMSFNETPESGIFEFLETPRYSSGYAALFQTLAFVPETHMLKAYTPRVNATLKLLDSFLEIVATEGETIANLRKQDREAVKTQTEFPIRWQLDTTQHRKLKFKGYTAEHKPSGVSGLPRLYYNRDRPFEKDILFYNQYRPTLTVRKPYAYLVPQAWEEVIQRLQLNGVVMKRLTKDMIIEVEAYRILNNPVTTPYEGHYVHNKIELTKANEKIQYHAGDYVIIMDQIANRYIVEVLEPQSNDSFFAWNFFDSILMQKEYYSSYVFEDLANELLDKNPSWRVELENHCAQDMGMVDNAYAQLDWVYKKSDYYEKTHRRYPVSRLLTPQNLPLE